MHHLFDLRRAAALALALGAVAAGPAAAPWPPRVASAAEAPEEEPTPEELAAARQLFKEGLALEKEDRWDEALEKFQRVAKVKLSPQVRFHLALCNEKLGNLVEAINGFELAEQEAKAVGPKARDVQRNAPARAKALRERVGYVRLSVTGTVRTSKILLDGKPVSEGLIDTEIPVEPGEHRVSVERDGETTFSETLDVSRRDVAELRLEIDDPEPPPESPQEQAAPGPDRPEPPPEEESSRAAAYVVGGFGLAAIAAGAVCWGISRSLLSEVRATCDDDDTGCDRDMEATATNGQTYTTVGNIAVPVGGAALATGVVLWFVLSPSEGEDDAESEPSVALVPTGTGAVVYGRF